MADLTPKAFVDWQAVQQVLAGTVTKGIGAALLFNLEGSLLTSAGDTSNEHIISALLSNIWKAFAGSKKGLEFMLLDCQDGKVAVTSVGRFRLCVYAKSYKYPLGMLRSKTEQLKGVLEKPLKTVF